MPISQPCLGEPRSCSHLSSADVQSKEEEIYDLTQWIHETNLDCPRRMSERTGTVTNIMIVNEVNAIRPRLLPFLRPSKLDENESKMESESKTHDSDSLSK